MKKVLFVDDETMNRVVASQILQKEGYEIVEAKDGVEALEILRAQNDVDLLLMDLMMPDMDGFAAIEAMKRAKRFRAFPYHRHFCPAR